MLATIKRYLAKRFCKHDWKLIWTTSVGCWGVYRCSKCGKEANSNSEGRYMDPDGKYYERNKR